MDIKKEAVRGTRWSALSMVVGLFLRMGAFAVLARVLDPAVFGVMSMLMVVVSIIKIFADMGMSGAFIHYQEVTHEELSTFFWVNIISGFVLWIISFAISPLVALYYHMESLRFYLPLLGVSFILYAPGIEYRVLLQKELRMKPISLIEIATESVTYAMIIVLALRGFGIFSLIAGELFRAFFLSLLLFLYGKREWMPSFTFFLPSMGRFFRFGAYQMGERTIRLVNQNLDYLIIGRYLGATPLGYYSLAYNIMLRPMQRVNPVITRVAFPALSKFQDDDATIKRYFLKMINLISFYSFPLYACLIAVAHPLVLTLYGPGWEPTARVLVPLSMLGMLYAIGNPMGSLLLAKGRADIGFWLNFYQTFVLIFALRVGSFWGIEGVAWTLFFSTLFIFVPVGFWVRKKVVGMGVFEYIKQTLSPLTFSVISCLITWGVGKFLFFSSHPLTLIVLLVVFLISYFVQVFSLERERFMGYVKLFLAFRETF